MSGADVFFDTNILVYLISAQSVKRDRAKAVMAGRGTINVQVLNEFVAVASRKYRVPWPTIREVLSTIKAVCHVDPLSIKTHDRAVTLAERYRFGIYDSLIIAAALEAGCSVLYSEDMQHSQIIEGLTILNPFAEL